MRWCDQPSTTAPLQFAIEKYIYKYKIVIQHDLHIYENCLGKKIHIMF